MSDKQKWARLAMAIDCEGYISICRSRTPYKPKNRPKIYTNTRFGLIIAVTNTDIRLMDWLVKNFGSTYSTAKTQQNPKWKMRSCWTVANNKNKEKVLLAVMPYLILKQDQAKVALEFLRLNGEPNPIKRNELADKMNILNRRGISVETNTLESSKSGDKIESELTGDSKSAPVVMQVA